MSMELMDLLQVGLLSWARQDARLTLEDVAARIAVAPAVIADWEAGKVPPTITELKRLARAYGRTTGIFFLPQPPLDRRLALAD